MIAEIRRWWDTHNTFGLDFDYLPIAKKCWIMANDDTRTRNPNRSLKYMRTRRSANIPEEYLMWKREHSPLWFSQHRVRWGLIDRAHSLKERKAIFHSHLLDKSSCFVFSFAICSCLFKRFQEH